MTYILPDHFLNGNGTRPTACPVPSSAAIEREAAEWDERAARYEELARQETAMGSTVLPALFRRDAAGFRLRAAWWRLMGEELPPTYSEATGLDPQTGFDAEASTRYHTARAEWADRLMADSRALGSHRLEGAYRDLAALHRELAAGAQAFADADYVARRW